MIDTDKLYEVIDEISVSGEIISAQARKQTLGVLKEQLTTLYSKTNDINIHSTIAYNMLIIEDCYNIDMYKFQFKGMKDILEKEIKNIKEAIALEGT